MLDLSVDFSFGFPNWHRDGACIEFRDTVDFFPERGQDSRPAKAVCAACLVRSECLQYALDERIKDGVWGGTSERERRKLRSKARAGCTVAA